jgi:hypothetical protein
MRRNQKNRLWSTLVTCILVILSSAMLRVTSAQTDPQTEERLPGVPTGYTIIDGDIQMPISIVNAMRQQAQMSPTGPTATVDTQLWPNGVIPFEFEITCATTSTCSGAPPSGCVSAAKQTAMLNAMAVLERVANVDFQQCPNNRCTIQCSNNICTYNFVHIRDSTNDTNAGMNNVCQNVSSNNSPVGSPTPFSGIPIINITSWGSQFTIVHELLHCLGFFHEQSRLDRNKFMQINCNNVQGGCSGPIYNPNFTIEGFATAYGYYDFDSVMHYGQCDFSIDCPPGTTCNCVNVTITVLPPYNAQWQNSMGQRNHLSTLDRATLSFLYPPADWRFLDNSYYGLNGPSDGSFLRPYTTFFDAVANTPEGGTLWLLKTQRIPAFGIYDKKITIRAAPSVIGTLGS